MKGAGLRSRRTSPPHPSQTVSGGSEIRCRTSKTRWQFWHSYSYVGTRTNATRRSAGVSRRAAAGLCLALACASVAACSPTRPAPPASGQRLRAQAAYERGIGYLRDREAALALAALREAVALDGGVPAYHDALGLLLLELRRPDMAVESFRRAVALDPGAADARLHLGVSLAEMGRWREAVPEYRAALGLPALTAESAVRQNLGLALYHLGEHEEAERELRFAIALDPRMDAAYYNLGLVLVAAGRPSDARVAFRHVRDASPQTPFGRAAIEQLRSLGEGG